MKEPAAAPLMPLCPDRQRLRWTAGVVWVGVMGLVLPGCSSAPRTAPSGSASNRDSTPTPATVAEPTTREQQALTTERQWLQSWFKDTPVRIAEEPGGLMVEVPLEFAFETGRSEPKAPLLAVLDKLSQSLRRQPQARLGLVAAPNDGSAVTTNTNTTRTTPLATQRAAQVRRYLIGRGVPASRLGPPVGTGAAALQLRMEIAAP